MEYKVITKQVFLSDIIKAKKVESFEKKINVHLELGWKLSGGISVARNEDYLVLAQALIKE